MTWAELLAAIKSEGEFDASTDYDSLILGIVNEVAKELTRKYNLNEFKVLGYELTPTAATQYTSLPSGFLRLSGRRMTYLQSGTDPGFLLSPLTLKKNKDIDGGVPRYFQIAQNKVYFAPFDGIATGDIVKFDYFKAPDVLASSGDTVSEPLDTCLKHAALARLLTIKDSKRAVFHLNEFKNAQIGMVTTYGTSD